MSKETTDIDVVWNKGVVMIPAHQWSAFLLSLQKQGIIINVQDKPSDSPEGITVLKEMGLQVKK